MHGIHMPSRGLLIACAIVCLPAWSITDAVGANSWQPDRNVEIIVSSATGGGNDRTARTIQQVIQAHRLLGTTLTVANKPGGGGTLAWTYLSQYPGNGHYLSTSISSLLTNHITGRSQFTYTRLTPIAQLFSEYIAFMVAADSPIQNARTLAEQLKNDPSSISITIGTGVGNHNHIALGMLTKAVGADPRKLKTVTFRSSSEATTALMGGHVEVAISPASSAVRQAKSGRVRIIAVTAPQRLRGELASVPTWQEHGMHVVVTNWRGIVGPPNLDAAQVSFWESTFAALVKTDDWRQDLEKNDLQDTFVSALESSRFLEAEYVKYKSALTDLGLVKGDKR